MFASKRLSFSLCHSFERTRLDLAKISYSIVLILQVVGWSHFIQYILVFFFQVEMYQILNSILL